MVWRLLGLFRLLRYPGSSENEVYRTCDRKLGAIINLFTRDPENQLLTGFDERSNPSGGVALFGGLRVEEPASGEGVLRDCDSD